MAPPTSNRIARATHDYTMKNIDIIAKHFPNCVTESESKDGNVVLVVDFDLLEQELSPDVIGGIRERFRLEWPGKRGSIACANAPTGRTLRPCRKESCEFDRTSNIFIEGDNLEALKLLQETYLNKVKVVYVDPPYNTGHDFVYKDKYSEKIGEYLGRSDQLDSTGGRLIANQEASGRMHSNWLSMLYPRLKLARQLLADDGAIFISIDDNEVNNLLAICYEIFGRESFLGLIPVIKNRKGLNSGSFHALTHEYLVAFRKKGFVSRGLAKSEAGVAEYDQLHSDGRRFKWDDLRKRGGEDREEDRDRMSFPIFVEEETGGVSLEATDRYTIEVRPKLGNGESGRWRWGLERVTNELADLRGRPVQGKDSWMIERPIFLTVENGGETRDKPKSVWEGPEFSTDHATTRLNKLIPNIIAKQLAPKPVAFIKQILELGMDSDDLFLDMFAGSGTGAEAMFERSVENGIGSRFILVQLDEPCAEGTGAAALGFSTVAEVSKERIRRAGAKIRAELEVQLEGEIPETDKHREITAKLANLDTGFRVLKVASSNWAEVYYGPDEITQDGLGMQVENIKSDRSPDDLLFQVLLDWGIDLALPIEQETIVGKTVFFVDGNALAACFDTGLDEDFVKALAKREPLRAVFRDASYANDATKINIEQIFKALSPHTEVKAI